MIYLQFCCFCVDLRIGTYIIAVTEILMDLIFGIFIALFGEAGEPDVCHKIFIMFMCVHLICTIVLLVGAIKLRPGLMLPYIIVTMVKVIAMIILLIADIILAVWVAVISLYVVMFFVGFYYWLVVYSFYAALGGDLFI